MSRVYAIIIRSEPPRHGTFFRSAGLTGLRAGKHVNSRWRKLGRIFMATGQYPWMASHTQLPAVDPAEAGVLRILFATRDRDNRSVIAFVDADATDPSQLIRLGEEPILGLGAAGCFDDSGVLPSWIVEHRGTKYLYYIGVNITTAVSGHTAIGVAKWNPREGRFERLFAGPILDRTPSEPYLCTSPCVIPGNPWRMWYTAGTGWETVDGRPEPSYNIRYAESTDGIEWRRPGIVCLDFKDSVEGGLARPSVVYDDGLYRMWFCARGRTGYRSETISSYRIVYAESVDGLSWTRMESPALGRDGSEWDSQMQAYPFVYRRGRTWHMLYNGNGFGQSGIGHAVFTEEIPG
jgi:hypothetical protein